MKLTVYLSGKEIHDEGKEISDLASLKTKLERARKKIHEIPIEKITGILNEFSMHILKSEALRNLEGAAYLSNWLRKSNFEAMLKDNLRDPAILDKYVEMGNKMIKAQPRGIAVHWIAGNIQMLALYSLFQSMAAKNANIVRVPLVSVKTVLAFLKEFGNVSYDEVRGHDLLEAVTIIYVPSKDIISNEAISRMADIRIIWGGENAVREIRKLDVMSHCMDMIFGPKYSFGVIDKKAVESANFDRILRNFILDIIFSEQTSCTSPHVLFFEASGAEMDMIMDRMGKNFNEISKRYPKMEIAPFIASTILEKRAEFGLEAGKKFRAGSGTSWSILYSNVLGLEDPVGHRTIFVKRVNDVMDVIPLITKRVQTIGCAIYDDEKYMRFSDAATYAGVARCVNPGTMNFFDSPWDGVFPIGQMVNWTYMKPKASEK